MVKSAKLPTHSFPRKETLPLRVRFGVFELDLREPESSLWHLSYATDGNALFGSGGSESIGYLTARIELDAKAVLLLKSR